MFIPENGDLREAIGPKSGMGQSGEFAKRSRSELGFNGPNAENGRPEIVGPYGAEMPSFGRQNSVASLIPLKKSRDSLTMRKSRNLLQATHILRTNPNPHVDYDKIRNDNQRRLETFDKTYEKQLDHFENPKPPARLKDCSPFLQAIL